jgi:hypothetical protein
MPENSTTIIQSLIQSRQSITQAELIRSGADAVRSIHRQYYLDALDHQVIAILFALVAVCRHNGEQQYKGRFENRELIIKTSGSVIEARLGEKIVLTNEKPEHEYLIPGDWLAFCKTELDRLEIEAQQKKETERKRRIALQAQKKIAEDNETFELFNL